MCDAMEFPDTVDEFMESYKIVDSEQVYTNGSELIQIFRMKQWLDHVQPVQERKGRWNRISPAKIYECSKCGKNVMTDDIEAYTFCHGCGAKMEGAEDARRNET